MPALLLDVQTPAGDVFYWADRPIEAVPAIAQPGPSTVAYLPWLLGAGKLTFNKTLKTDTGSLTLQNTSGNTLQAEFEAIARRSVLEGSIFVLRYFAADLEWPWIEQHGTLTVGETGSTVQITLQQMLSGSDDTPVGRVGETCQLIWGEARCGATGPQECLYTYSTCQVVEHFCGIQTGFETNNAETVAQLAVTPVNRNRSW